MNSEEIEISIAPDGRVEYRIKGVKGSACESISALLEQIGKVEHAERTGEYYEDESHATVNVGQS